MCYILNPSDLLAFMVTRKTVSEISFKRLKSIREIVESKNNAVYVEITSRAVINAVNSYPDLFEMDDTKIIIHKQNLKHVKSELEQSAESLPSEYRQILEQIL